VALGLGGALFHALNHSLFKPLLFFSAGSVLHATGTRRISALGGLARRMPHTFALFALGAVAICGLPPLNGFTAIAALMGLLRAGSDAPGPGWEWASLAAPVLAMIGALAVASFVKVAGVAFCGSARSSAAAHAHDPGRGMLAPMGTLAGACILLGLFPSVAVPLLQRAVAAWDPALGGAAPPLAAAPLAGVTGVVLVVSVAVFTALFAGAGQAVAVGPGLWHASPTPRMRYVEASFGRWSASSTGRCDPGARIPDCRARFRPLRASRARCPMPFSTARCSRCWARWIAASRGCGRSSGDRCKRTCSTSWWP
jgi:hydrogenase-4 component B